MTILVKMDPGGSYCTRMTIMHHILLSLLNVIFFRSFILLRRIHVVCVTTYLRYDTNLPPEFLHTFRLMPPKQNSNVNNPAVNKRGSKRKSKAGKPAEISDDESPERGVTEKPALEKVYWEKDLSRTDRLLDWLESNPSDRQKLFSDSARDAKEENRPRHVARGAKSEFHTKIALYVFSVDTDARVRKEVVTNVNKYAKAVENRLGS